jgi:16S rRNA (cytosine967-C5)-methyltransferase
MPTAAPRVETALLVGAAQILWLDVPDHAAVDLSVRLVQADRRAARYAGLVNAVLRRFAQNAAQQLRNMQAVALDTPAWLLARWEHHYGRDTAHAIAAANSREPALDLTVKADPDIWAKTLNGRVLPTGTLRLIPSGPVSQLAGFAEGAWWVQDAAAALPAKLLAVRPGERVADLCAAPGGKTAQLAAAGARVVAVERDPRRAARLAENLRHWRLAAEIVQADATDWTPPEPFDAVLLDAPCSATGTIRRHPDVPRIKRQRDVRALTQAQDRLLSSAIAMLRPGGRLVYSVCSLQPDEGAPRVAHCGMRHDPFTERELAAVPLALTPEGFLRTLPCMWPELGGMDGFFAARLVR